MLMVSGFFGGIGLAQSLSKFIKEVSNQPTEDISESLE